MCGGGPWGGAQSFCLALSPPVWECSLAYSDGKDEPVVFPTYVGVFLSVPCSMFPSFCRPHMRGDVPRFYQTLGLNSLPHLCGDVPVGEYGCSVGDHIFPIYMEMLLEDIMFSSSSPHVLWGCSLFDAQTVSLFCPRLVGVV